jgi:hypothetical protein
MKMKTLYKFRSLETRGEMLYLFRTISCREIYFSDPQYFNDPFDCKIAEHLRRYVKPYGVLCFSTNDCDMVLMFSHYANRHKGLCLQFQVDVDNTDTLCGREVIYCREDPKLPDDPNEAHRSYLTKHKRWSYESEYRVVWHVKAEADRVQRYKHGELCGVIFGLHMSSDDESIVRSWFLTSEHRDISFMRAVRDENDPFALKFLDA